MPTRVAFPRSAFANKDKPMSATKAGAELMGVAIPPLGELGSLLPEDLPNVNLFDLLGSALGNEVTREEMFKQSMKDLVRPSEDDENSMPMRVIMGLMRMIQGRQEPPTNQGDIALPGPPQG